MDEERVLSTVPSVGRTRHVGAFVSGTILAGTAFILEGILYPRDLPEAVVAGTGCIFLGLIALPHFLNRRINPSALVLRGEFVSFPLPFSFHATNGGRRRVRTLYSSLPRQVFCVRHSLDSLELQGIWQGDEYWQQQIDPFGAVNELKEERIHQVAVRVLSLEIRFCKCIDPKMALKPFIIAVMASRNRRASN
jgi:hypothetical protein